MKRLNPIGSLLGLIFTILLFVGLGISLIYNRGLAFSPGPVTAISRDGIILQGFVSHADFEKQCRYCHEPLKTDLAAKCMLCHENVLEQTQSDEGVHSKIEIVRQCGECHPEHRGRDFDPTSAAYQLFDHSRTSFSLNWHQQNYDATPMQCDACHINSDFSNVENQACLDCHDRHNKNFVVLHTQSFGSNCLGCHDGFDRMQNFDHAQTGYQLEGQHMEVVCSTCHTQENLEDTPTACMDCHMEPSIHLGLFDDNCSLCHTPEGWTPANLDDHPFSHLEDANFSLVLHQVDYSDQIIQCSTCHPSDLKVSDLQTCVDCHTQHDEIFMVDHQEQLGSDCIACHDGVDRLSNFDHNNFFKLDGEHLNIDCSACHIDKVFLGTPTECGQCHEEPEIHKGVFGLQCDNCHSTDAWSPARLEEHSFPLNHGLVDRSAQLQCDACHGTTFIEYTCYNCHDHEPAEMAEEHLKEGIGPLELPECAKCHPNGLEDEAEQD